MRRPQWRVPSRLWPTVPLEKREAVFGDGVDGAAVRTP